jgi:hypothetical protein
MKTKRNNLFYSQILDRHVNAELQVFHLEPEIISKKLFLIHLGLVTTRKKMKKLTYYNGYHPIGEFIKYSCTLITGC